MSRNLLQQDDKSLENDAVNTFLNSLSPQISSPADMDMHEFINFPATAPLPTPLDLETSPRKDSIEPSHEVFEHTAVLEQRSSSPVFDPANTTTLHVVEAIAPGILEDTDEVQPSASPMFISTMPPIDHENVTTTEDVGTETTESIKDRTPKLEALLCQASKEHDSMGSSVEQLELPVLVSEATQLPTESAECKGEKTETAAEIPDSEEDRCSRESTPIKPQEEKSKNKPEPAATQTEPHTVTEITFVDDTQSNLISHKIDLPLTVDITVSSTEDMAVTAATLSDYVDKELPVDEAEMGTHKDENIESRDMHTINGQEDSLVADHQLEVKENVQRLPDVVATGNASAGLPCTPTVPALHTAKGKSPSEDRNSRTVVPRKSTPRRSQSVEAVPREGRRLSGRKKSAPTGFAAQYVSWGDIGKNGLVKSDVESVSKSTLGLGTGIRSHSESQERSDSSQLSTCVVERDRQSSFGHSDDKLPEAKEQSVAKVQKKFVERKASARKSEAAANPPEQTEEEPRITLTAHNDPSDVCTDAVPEQTISTSQSASEISKPASRDESEVANSEAGSQSSSSVTLGSDQRPTKAVSYSSMENKPETHEGHAAKKRKPDASPKLHEVNTTPLVTFHGHMISPSFSATSQNATEPMPEEQRAQQSGNVKDSVFAELKAMKLASIQARNSQLKADIATMKEKLVETTRKLKNPPASTVKRHIDLLHDYNDIRDVGQGLIGLIADNRGVRIGELYEEFGVGLKD